MNTKQLLAMALMSLMGASQALADAFQREAVIGNDTVNFHTELERNALVRCREALGNAQNALSAAVHVSEKEEDDSLEIPD